MYLCNIIVFLSSFVLALLVFLGVVLFPCLIKNFSSKSNFGKLVLGLLLSYCSRFCNLIALLWAPKTNSMEVLRGLSIWDKITSPEIMWGFIIVLFFISSVTNFVTVMYVEGAFLNSIRKEERGNSTQYSHGELLINLAVIHGLGTVSSERSLVKIKPYITTSSLITATCMCFHKQLITRQIFCHSRWDP